MSVRKPLAIFLLFLASIAFPQANPNFNVHLSLNIESAERALELYDGRSGRGRDIAMLRGSQIALATTALLAQRHLTTAQLEETLDLAKFGQLGSDDVFRIKEARERSGEIRELLTEIRRRRFAQRVVSTVEQLFPFDAEVRTMIPVYFVAFGHQNIDAFVRRVLWRNDSPVFVGEGEGELTIVVNLASGVKYGRTLDERIIGTLSVVAHEVFHAAFGVYKDNSESWRAYYALRRSYIEELLDLTHNEGIAHYLSFEQRSRGYLPRDWDQKVRTSFDEFNRNAEALMTSTITPHRAGTILRASNTSGYWESYGAITGLFIAREIDRTLGRRELAETIASPLEFYRKYIEMCAMNSNLPTLSQRVVSNLHHHR